MRIFRLKQFAKLLLCFFTGSITTLIFYGYKNDRKIPPLWKNGWTQDWQNAAKNDRPNVAQVDLYSNELRSWSFGDDVSTKTLIYVLERKLKDLRDSGMLLSIGVRGMCPQRLFTFTRCIEPNCTQPLPPRLSIQNIESIRKPVKRVGLNKLREVIKAFDVKPETKRVVIVMGASSNHFQESEAALQSLHRNVLPHLTNYSLVYYDLGLTESQREMIQMFSGAELKTFPFDKLPERFADLTCYLWKPLIILAHLQRAEFLVWMDSSMYIKDLRPYINNASKTGILLNENSLHFPQHVSLEMFSYFGDEACQFSTYGESEAGLLILHNEPFIRHLVIEPWSACALDTNCMCPTDSIPMGICSMKIRKYGKCHRYDQAAIGYILIKSLRENIESVHFRERYHKVRWGQRELYLERLKVAKELKGAATEKF